MKKMFLIIFALVPFLGFSLTTDPIKIESKEETKLKPMVDLVITGICTSLTIGELEADGTRTVTITCNGPSGACVTVSGSSWSACGASGTIEKGSGNYTVTQSGDLKSVELRKVSSVNQ